MPGPDARYPSPTPRGNNPRETRRRPINSFARTRHTRQPCIMKPTKGATCATTVGGVSLGSMKKGAPCRRITARKKTRANNRQKRKGAAIVHRCIISHPVRGSLPDGNIVSCRRCARPFGAEDYLGDWYEDPTNGAQSCPSCVQYGAMCAACGRLERAIDAWWTSEEVDADGQRGCLCPLCYRGRSSLGDSESRDDESE